MIVYHINDIILSNHKNQGDNKYKIKTKELLNHKNTYITVCPKCNQSTIIKDADKKNRRMAKEFEK